MNLDNNLKAVYILRVNNNLKRERKPKAVTK